MKRVFLLTSVGIFFSVAGFAQANTDSMAIVAKISEYQLQLGKLQNKIAQKTNDKQNDSLRAQQSAATNSTAASNLSADPQDKGDARRANNAASDAKGDSRRARKASDRLDDLNKNIQDLQNKIAEQQTRLSKFTHMAYTPVMPVIAAPVDSSRH